MRMISGANDQPFDQHEVPGLLVGLPRLAVEDLLVGPEQVDGGHNDTQDGDHGPPAVGDEGAREHEELASEAVEARHADGGHHHQR